MKLRNMDILLTIIHVELFSRNLLWGEFTKWIYLFDFLKIQTLKYINIQNTIQSKKKELVEL